MNPRLYLLSGLLFASIAGLAGGLMLVQLRREQRLQQRTRTARGQGPVGPGRVPAAAKGVPVRLVAGVGSAIARSGLLPARTLSELEQTLAASGLRGSNGLGLFVGAKILLMIACPLIAVLAAREMSFGPTGSRMVPLAAMVIGMLAPDKIVSRNRDRHRAKLDSGVPDVLDMMVICTQAGLGLAPAMERVAGEIAHSQPAIARELAQTVGELQIAVDGGAALTALGVRTGLESLKRVTTTLVQTIQYGTPLTDALRSLAAEMRQEALIRYEEKAARLPVLLTVPMIVFVLPCVFIVVGGPAALQISKALGH